MNSLEEFEDISRQRRTGWFCKLYFVEEIHRYNVAKVKVTIRCMPLDDTVGKARILYRSLVLVEPYSVDPTDISDVTVLPGSIQSGINDRVHYKNN